MMLLQPYSQEAFCNMDIYKLFCKMQLDIFNVEFYLFNMDVLHGKDDMSCVMRKSAFCIC